MPREKYFFKILEAKENEAEVTNGCSAEERLTGGIIRSSAKNLSGEGGGDRGYPPGGQKMGK